MVDDDASLERAFVVVLLPYGCCTRRPGRETRRRQWRGSKLRAPHSSRTEKVKRQVVMEHGERMNAAVKVPWHERDDS